MSFLFTKLISSETDDNDGDCDDVLGERPQRATLMLIPSSPCCCTTTGGLRLPTMSAQEYLFIRFPSWRENSSFFYFLTQ